MKGTLGAGGGEQSVLSLLLDKGGVPHIHRASVIGSLPFQTADGRRMWSGLSIYNFQDPPQSCFRDYAMFPIQEAPQDFFRTVSHR